MKYLFAVIVLVLACMAVGTYWSYPDMRSEVPVLYWVTDANPARDLQIELLHRWQITEGHCTEHRLTTPAEVRAFAAKRWTPAMIKTITQTQPETEALFAPGGPDLAKLDLPLTVKAPLFEMRTDSANRDVSKQIIQGVSGVAGDNMDLGGGTMRYFVEIGLLEDVTESAEQMGYDVSKTYPATAPEISVDGRQYSFPCNVYAHMYWVNRATFRSYHQPPPPKRWTLEEFEQRGKAFVDAANEGLSRRKVFFANRISMDLLYRSMGVDVLNETLTASNALDPRWARALALQYKWTFEDHLIPTASDLASFDTQEGYGGVTLQLFNRGNFAMFSMGRYALIQLRKFGQLELMVVEPPHGGFPTTSTGSRSNGVYVASDHPELAKLFQKYLASEAYNMQIVRDADALPPIPRFCETEQFLYPPDYPNEWGTNDDGTRWSVHEAFYDAAQHIAIGNSYSPFVNPSTVNRIRFESRDKYLNDKATVEEVAQRVHGLIAKEITRTVEADEQLQREFEQAVADQKKIEQLRAAGRKVPLALITNPFYRRYYVAQGWAE